MAVLVKDVMSSPALTIDINKTARDAGKLMRKHRRGFLIVTEKTKPVGVISESDLIEEVVCKNIRSDKVKLKNLMHEPIIAVGPEDTILTASRKMKENNIHRLPVIENGKVIGVISLTDIARTSPEMLDLLEYRLKMKEKPFEIKEKTTIGICDSCDNYSDDLRIVDDQWLCEDCREESEL
ncbi:MAG: CBS domain-containing protein [Candidatus Aenigmatarchaeota archaeon]|nr:CBS domain-containing protein [Candidatus Aenigmarchaeota archaeon]